MPKKREPPGERKLRLVVPPPDPRAPARTREQVVAAICKRIEAGTPVSHAAALEWCPKQRLYEWMASDDAIAAQVRCAQAVASEARRETFEALVDTDAKTASAYLHYMARLAPDEYAPPTQKVESTSHVTQQSVVVHVEGSDIPRLKSEARAQLAAKAGDDDGEDDDEDFG